MCKNTNYKKNNLLSFQYFLKKKKKKKTLFPIIRQKIEYILIVKQRAKFNLKFW